MKAILPILASVALASIAWSAGAQTPLQTGNRPGAPGNPPVAAPPGDMKSGDALVRRAAAAIDAHSSIAARLRHKVDLMDRPMFGSGVYLQQGRGPQRMMRLELKLQTTPQASSVQEICDGTALWICEDVGGSTSLSRVDMSRLRRARPKSPAPPPALSAWSALGGLPKVLANLESSFRFGPVVEGRLDDLRVWTLEGRWKPAELAALLPDQKAEIDAGTAVDLTRLAPNVPDRVTLHVGCDDLFPYRIEYWRADPAHKSPKPDDRGKLLVVMELYEVQLGAAIDPSQFAYSPLNVPAIDRTPAFLDKLGLEEVVAGEANQKLEPRR